MGGLYTLHQVCMTLVALVGVTAAVLSFVTTTFAFGELGALRATLTSLGAFAYLFVLSVLLLLAAAFGALQPLLWLGCLGSFTGSGLYATYLGLLIYTFLGGAAYGLPMSVFCIAVGVLSIVLGLAWKERDTATYYSLVN
ncbi:hypothetical protein SDRG_08319 [Saprolegnia diclina VS20]|uniref:Uncharacterized protein n=1 Tax=Saprolegnia diclina (strain VS20) TaxID=1156394 RepID=T0QK24_SAPDV|nr:hypothetical protein SDRG_08319 [Saprolegnia diclina VS20]EQC34110.1 hypothetical protein SDRG_08319 [Saprolegnia diclina VS20]|eukprot:XP_008612422.1 hypothetical protein SDRG_08319 [Saprolegnia diclina VS20]